MTGYPDKYKIRLRDYRIGITIDKDNQVVCAVHVTMLVSESLLSRQMRPKDKRNPKGIIMRYGLKEGARERVG